MLKTRTEKRTKIKPQRYTHKKERQKETCPDVAKQKGEREG